MVNGRERYRHLRSLLEVPILIDRYWAKVPSVEADAVMMDLEDSAPAAAKDEARARVRAALNDPGYFGGRQMVVRVNNLATPWGRDDLAMLAASDADVLVCYPKAEDPGEIAEVVDIVRAGRADRAIWAMIETPAAITGLSGIAGVDGLAGLHFGYTDYCAELGVSPFDAQGVALGPAAAFAAHMVAVAAAANGLFATGGSMVPDFRDEAKVTAFLSGWVAAGYTACLALSPGHVPAVNRAFTPAPEEVALARAGVAAFDAAIAAGQANAMVGDRIVTLPEYRRLKQLLARVR